MSGTHDGTPASKETDVHTLYHGRVASDEGGVGRELAATIGRRTLQGTEGGESHGTTSTQHLQLKLLHANHRPRIHPVLQERHQLAGVVSVASAYDAAPIRDFSWRMPAAEETVEKEGTFE